MARMVESNPQLAEQTDAGVPAPAVRATHRLHTCRPAGGAGALQGWNPSLAIVDESHVVTCVVCREPGRRQRSRSLTLAISTPARSARVMWGLVVDGW